MPELPPDISGPLDDDRLAQLADALARFPDAARARGADLVLAERVTEERVEAGEVVARVRDGRVFAVRWRLDAPAAIPLCSCSSGPECAHAVAAGLRLLAGARAGGRPLSPAARGLLPAPWRAGAAPEPPSWLARTGGAQVASPPARDPRLRALREAEAPWMRIDAAEKLLWNARLPGVDVAALPLNEIAYENDADLRCWRLARAVRDVTGGSVPRVLEPWADREDLEARSRESTRRIVVERLSTWAGGSGRSPRHLRVVLGLARADAGAPVRVTLQARLTGPKLDDAPRSASQLQQLHAEVRRDRHLLSPPQARLLRLLTENEMSVLFDTPATPRAVNHEQLNLLLDRAAGSSFVWWSESLPPDLAARAGVTAGARANLEGDDVRVVLDCHAEGGALRMGLALTDPAGHRWAIDDALLWSAERAGWTSHPTVALLDGAFRRVADEPPPDIVRMIVDLHGVDLSPEDAPLLDRLAARFDTVAGALRGLTHVHDAAPLVTLDLRASDWLQVRALARTGAWRPGARPAPGERVFEFTSAGAWMAMTPAERAPEADDVEAIPALDAAAADAADAAIEPAPDGAPAQDGAPEPAPEPAPADVPGAGFGAIAPWRHVPEPGRVASALAWLEQLGAASGVRRGAASAAPPEPDADAGWWLRLHPRQLEQLDAAWASRPRDVEWFGNRAVRDLLSGRRRVRARVAVAASGIDWLALRADWESEGLALSDADLAKLRGSRETFVRLSGGWVRREDADAHDRLAGALADLGLEPDGSTQTLSLWQLAQVRAESLEVLADAGVDEETRDAVVRIRGAIGTFAGVPSVDVPAGLVGTLRPYQRSGLDFLAWRSSLGLGAVLADDMGLGKTVQALAWLLYLRDRDPAGGPALVVCPATVAHNWEREAARFAPSLKVLVLASGRGRRTQLREVGDHDLVITNYALLRRDLAHWREVPLRAVILDEAQNIKNPDAAVSRATLELRAPNRIALTGTPLENRALDLWSILAFVQPGLLGPRAAFVARYDRPDAAPHVRRLLAARLRPVMLRRLKGQVERDLPARIEERLDCQLTPGQRRLYSAELVRARALLGTLAGEPGGIAKRRIVILAVLTRLRQICCHPALVDADRSLGSGKLDALLELLEPLRAEGQKVLVYSQFVRCLDLIASRLRHDGLPFHVLTGATPTAERGKVVSAFTEDPEPSVFLLSLKAGGTGLNLTAASHVVLFDPWWNPAAEAQAIDRTHRIGQSRSVVAWRLYAEDTIEERIAELQRRKAQLVRDVLGEDGFARLLTREDLDYLLAD